MAYLALRNKEVAGLRWDGFDDPMESYTLVGKGNRTRTVPGNENCPSTVV